MLPARHDAVLRFEVFHRDLEDGREDVSGQNIGRPYNELLITLMTKTRLTHDEWELNGEPGFGDYRVKFKGRYDFGDRRSPLPNV